MTDPSMNADTAATSIESAGSPAIASPAPKHLLIVDLETTGLNPKVDGVLEWGAILYSIPYQTVVHQCSMLFDEEENPQTHLNHIPAGIVSQMTRTEDILDAFGKMLTGMMYEADYVVAHNAKFDRQWFDTTGIVLANEQKQPLPWLCTMSDFVFPKQSRSRLSLVNLCLDHRISVWSAHRALTDCQLIAALFDRMESPEVLQQMVVEAAERADRPKYLYRAMVSFQERQKAKDAGFHWDKERKMWLCELSEVDIQTLPFQVVQLFQEGEKTPEASAAFPDQLVER